MNAKKITALIASLALLGAAIPAQNLLTTNAETYEYLEYYVGGYYNWETDEYEQQIVIEGCDPSFSGDLVIPSEIGGLSVGRIDYSAFSGCTNLTSVTIPDSVTRIDWYAFQNCTNLTSVNIPDSVTNLGSSVFRGCSSLTTVTLPNSMTEISSNAFRDCSSLTSVIIPDSVEAIDSYAFANTGLTSITIPENVKTIGYSSFAGSALASVDILGSDTIICGFAFDACPNFTEMNISENNINYSFENGVLYNKDKTVLKQYLNANTAPEFTVPDTVKTIAGWAFDGNQYLTSVNIPDSVEKIAIYAFDNCPNLTNINISETNANYSFENGTLYDKDKTTLKQFLANTPVTEFVIPETVTSITGYAFENAQNLTSITIPEGVEFIGNYAFAGCTGLTSMKLPENMEHLGAGVFSGCTALTDVNIPSNLQYLSYLTFKDCKNLSSVTLPDGLIYIGWGAFTGSGIESIEIPAGVTFINDTVFMDCENLRSVSLPESLTSISSKAFMGCSSLPSIVIPDSVTDIYWSAFADCTALESVHLPAGLGNFLESYMFNNCTSLTSVEIPQNVERIGKNAFNGCTSLTSVSIPANVNYIGYQAFDNCTSLTGLDISPDNTAYASENGALFNKEKTVLKQYFMGNSETEYTIPDTVTSIGGLAFSSCSNLSAVTVPATVKNIAFNAFYDSNAVINGYENTAAQAHAEKNNYQFVSLGKAEVQEYKTGDATGEGDINIIDVIAVNKAVMGKENLTEPQLKAIDFNGNGKPDSEESLTILKYIVGLVTSFTA